MALQTLPPSLAIHGHCNIPNSKLDSQECETICIQNRLIRSSCCQDANLDGIILMTGSDFSSNRDFLSNSNKLCDKKCVCAPGYAKVFISKEDASEYVCISESFCSIRCPPNAVFLQAHSGFVKTLYEIDGKRTILNMEYRNHNGCMCLKGYVKRNIGKFFECVSEEDALACPTRAKLQQCANKKNICLNGVLMRENFLEECELGCVCEFPNVLTYTTDSKPRCQPLRSCRKKTCPGNKVYMKCGPLCPKICSTVNKIFNSHSKT